MITAIILSKDRASQLHLLLESIQRNSGNLFDIRVIYEASNAVFERGYQKTKALRYEQFHAPVVKAIQELDAKVTTLTERVAALE